MAFYSNKIVTKQLQRFGEEVDIYRKSEGSADDYGDAAPTWSEQATEYVMFDTLEGFSGFTARHEVAGRMKDVEKIAYAKSDTDAEAGDYLDASENWFILFTEPFKVAANTVYTILFLKRFE